MIAVGVAWLYPADSYLLLPDRAKPLANLVKVEGEKPHPPGGILYVDVIVRQASVLEELAAASPVPTAPTSSPRTRSSRPDRTIRTAAARTSAR